MLKICTNLLPPEAKGPVIEVLTSMERISYAGIRSFASAPMTRRNKFTAVNRSIPAIT